MVPNPNRTVPHPRRPAFSTFYNTLGYRSRNYRDYRFLERDAG